MPILISFPSLILPRIFPKEQVAFCAVSDIWSPSLGYRRSLTFMNCQKKPIFVRYRTDPLLHFDHSVRV